MRTAVTPAFLAQLEKSDPARVPANTVRGQPEALSTSATGATFRVVTDGGRVDVVTHKSGNGCLVSDLQPADTVPGAPTPVLMSAPGAG
jgi:hypothetical protein